MIDHIGGDMIEKMVRTTCDRCGHVELNEAKDDSFGVIGFYNVGDKLICDSCYLAYKNFMAEGREIIEHYLSGKVSIEDINLLNSLIKGIPWFRY